MESVGELCSPFGASSNLLSLPAPCPWDEDEESLGLEGIKPKSSPTPRRRSSESSDDFEPPGSSSRRVSFADAFGLNLVSVKQFDTWGVTAPSGPLENDLNEDREYYMVPLFTLPQTVEELTLRVHEQKLELESLELLSGTTILRGTVRVLNVCFDKMVYVRTSLDSWRSHFDLLAEYVPGSYSGEMDCFSFKLTLVPPFVEGGARVDFCLRYDTSVGTFWANNNENNYSLLCCEKIKEKPQSESENRRKSCLKASSSNFSASTVVATNNEELPDINLISGTATNSGSLNENSEKLEKENKELREEISRNHSRRNRRKAARLAKVKEHFAKREEERKQGTKTKEIELTAATSLLEKTSCSPQSQQTARPPTDNQISPAAKTLNIGDSTDNTSQILAQHQEDNKINSKFNLSTAHTDLHLDDSIGCDKSRGGSDSDVLEDIQLTEDLADQNLSTSQSLPVCQNPDSSICKNVERAWEHFEKDAKQRLKSLALSPKTDEDENISDEKREDDVSLKTNNTEPQLFSQGFTFGTIVAPLYHQVFKNMETKRKDLMPKNLQVDRPFRELEDESLNAVPAPETTDIWPESCLSTKQTVHDISVGACQESTEQNSHITVNPTNNLLSQPNKSKCVKKAEDSHNTNDYTGGCPREITFTETNLPKVTSREPDPPLGEMSSVCTTEFPSQWDPCHSSCLLSSQGSEHVVIKNQTTEAGVDNLLEQINPSLPTSVLKTSSSLENLISCVKTEMSQNKEDPTNTQTKEENTSVQTEYSIHNSCILVQSPDEPTMSQDPGISLGSTEDELDHGCFEMSSDIEKPEEHSCFATAMPTELHTDLEDNKINMNTLESCQINEKEEQMQSFSTQTSEEESISDRKHLLDKEHETSVIKELEEVHKIENDEEEMEKDQETEVQEGAQEKHEDEGGIKSIEDELKYIDDEEDVDAMETERDDLLSLGRDSEEQKISSTRNAKSLQHHTDVNKTERLDGVEVLENKDRFFNSGVKICEETSTSRSESSVKSDTELRGGLENDWNLTKFIDEDNIHFESENSDKETIDDVNDILENMECQVKESMNRDLENIEDNTSTESQTDDEMELYLNSLRNSQQSMFRDATTSGGYAKRPSVSRGRPLAMPSISESVDEDQMNSSLEDLTNFDPIMEQEKATDRNEHVIGRNVLWWKEFLSYDNMSRMTGYTFLLIVFLVAAYYYDFIACFALYLLTVYWLFRQGEREPLRYSLKGKRGLE